MSSTYTTVVVGSGRELTAHAQASGQSEPIPVVEFEGGTRGGVCVQSSYVEPDALAVPLARVAGELAVEFRDHADVERLQAVRDELHRQHQAVCQAIAEVAGDQAEQAKAEIRDTLDMAPPGEGSQWVDEARCPTCDGRLFQRIDDGDLVRCSQGAHQLHIQDVYDLQAAEVAS